MGDRRTSGWTAVLAVILVAAGATPGAAQTDSEIVAEWDGGTVTAEEFRSFLKHKIRGLAGAADLTEPARERFLRAYLVLWELRDGVDEGLEERRNLILRQSMVRHIRDDAVESGLDIPVSELRAYYVLHKSEFETSETYFFRHIFLNTADLEFRARAPGVPEEERLSEAELEQEMEEKRKRAEEAAGRIRAGEDFVEVAREYSESGGEEHPEERGIQLAAEVRDDGLYVRDARIMAEMEEFIRSLAPGETSPVFKTVYGFEILRVEKHVPAGVLPFDDVKERIARRRGRDARRTAQERMDEELLQTFDVVERYEVLDDPLAPPEATVMSLKGPEGDFVFMVADYRAFLEKQSPAVQERFASSADVRNQHLRNYILLDWAAYFLAKRQGLDRDPELRRRADTILLETIAEEELNRRIEEKVKEEEISESRLREEYEKPMAARFFQVGDEVRLMAFAVGSLATEESSPSARRFGLRYALQLAEKVSTRLRKGEDYDEVAAEYAVSSSDQVVDATRIAFPGGVYALALSDRPLGAEQLHALGDLGWMRQEDLVRFNLKSTEAAKAVMKLATGEVIDTPVAYVAAPDGDLPGPDGYLVFQCSARRDGGLRPFEEVKEQLEQIARARRIQELRVEMVNEMIRQVEYDINDAVWKRVWGEFGG